jgi:hypothetical protein
MELLIMELKVNQEQLDRLYRFTREHFVEHYDLQTELVDHLSNAIEQQWRESPKLSFEDALQREFKKFGVFGFMDVVEKRQKALTKRYYGFVWKQFITFFKLPKVILTISLMGILFKTITLISFKKLFVTVLVFGFLAFFLFWQLNMYRNRKKQKSLNKKRWIMEELIFQCGTGSAIPVMVQFLVHSLRADYHGVENIGFQLFFSILFVITAIVFYILVIIIPSKAEEYLKKTYPEYAFSN